MREWLKLFEDEQIDSDAAADAADAAAEERWAREKVVTATIKDACVELDLDLTLDRAPVVYDEEDNRSAVIRIDGSVSLEQLSKLAHLGTNWTISPNPNPGAHGLLVEFNVAPNIGQ